jgi:hypothetical protein
MSLDTNIQAAFIHRLSRHTAHPTSSSVNPQRGRQFDACDFSGYAKWLCENGEDGLLNMVDIFLCVCNIRGIASVPIVSSMLS